MHVRLGEHAIIAMGAQNRGSMLAMRNVEGPSYVRAKLREHVIRAQNRGSMQGALKA